MIRKILVTALVLTSGTAAAEPLRLSLADAVKIAVEKNLPLQVERYNPGQYEAAYLGSKGLYNPSLKLEASHTDSTEPAAGLTTRTSRLNAGISQLLSTGATATVSFANTYLGADQTSNLAGRASYWQSSLGFSISQPLLKGRGREVTELAIDSARLTMDASLEGLRGSLSALIAQIRTEYFALYSLKEEVLVRRASLELAKRVLHDTRARVAAGTMPAMETLNAEYGVAGREKELIDTEQSVKNQEDLLLQLLQQPLSHSVELTDVPSQAAYPLVEHQEIQRAYELRPELKALQKNIEQQELQTRVTSNRMLPDLTATAAVSTGGLGANYPRDFDRMSSGNYPVWEIGLAFSYPLGNQTAEYEYRRNRIKSDQLVLQLKNQRELIANEVRAAVRGVEAGYKQLEVTERGSRFAEERMNAWSKKLGVGLATTKDLLDVENDLATARNNRIKALTGYAAAITQLWKVTGQIVEKQELVLSEALAGKLAGGKR